MNTNTQYGSSYDLVGSSLAMQRVRSLIKDAASTDMNVLILGETGVGKELVARHIHKESGRVGKYTTVNCAAIPEGLLESELFGYRRGAFTSADIRGNPGVFQYAERGTVFLDEILDMVPQHQSKLLRFLQEKEVATVGNPEVKKVDVKVIAATNHDLEYELSRGNLRRDLYYRLNGFTIYVPPLRKRLDDLPALIRHFIVKYNRFGFEITGIDPEVMVMFAQHSWLGNVRELENYVQRAIVEYKKRHSSDMEQAPKLLSNKYFKGFVMNMSPSTTIQLPETIESTVSLGNSTSQTSLLKAAVKRARQEVEAPLIRKALEQTHWNRSATARILGISYKALLYKMNNYGLKN